MALPRLTAISRRHDLGPGGLGAWIEALARAGVDAVQIREKDASDLELFELVSLAVARAASRLRVLVNGRADVALAAGATGVHLPADGVPVEAVRRLAGRRLLVGCSTHSLDEIERAREAGADYVYFGPIFETPGKSAVGIEALGRATRLGVPVIALGGIRIDRLEAVAESGAAGVAAIRMFSQPAGLAELAAIAERLFPRS